MSDHSFERQTQLDVSREALFAWHERPGAFERLAPPFAAPELVETDGTLKDGARTILKVPAGPISRRWVAEHRDYRAGYSFTDVQVSGPFAKWEHTHRFADHGAGSRLTDSIRYRLPLAPISHWVAGGFVAKQLKRTFDFREFALKRDFELAAALRSQFGDAPLPAKVAIAGASGLIGSALQAALSTQGVEVVQLVRRPAGEGQVHWDPRAGVLDPKAIEDCGAVIHLGGANIAEGRWSDQRKRVLTDSRVQSTRLIARTLAELGDPQRTLVVASAVGYYGAQRGDEELDESSAPADDFLGELCQQWEAAADPARAAGVRVAHSRFGVVLDPRGGALKKLLPVFLLGGGGPVGSGRQWMSWIGVEDAIGLLIWALADPSFDGPYVAAAPEPIQQRDFAKVLGRVLRRPSFVPTPALAIRAAFGEMGEATVLGSQRAFARKVGLSAYPYATADLESALRGCLGR